MTIRRYRPSDQGAVIALFREFMWELAPPSLGDEFQDARPGTWVHMAAGLRHSIQARTPTVMLLILLKQPAQ